MPEGTPQEDPQEAVLEFSPQPSQGAARGRRDKVTPAWPGGGHTGGGGGGGELEEGAEPEGGQISALEKLKAQSRVSSASTLFEEDDPLP